MTTRPLAQTRADAAASVPVRPAFAAWFYPRKFCNGKINEAAQMEAFFARFKAAAPDYVKSAPAGALDVLQWMSGYFRHVLLG